MIKDKTSKLAIGYYKKIGVKGLSACTNKKLSDALINYILSYLNKNDKILDLACGYGRITIPLAKKGYNIEGIDITKDLIDYAKKKSKIIFKVGDMRDLPYKNENFDKIICLWSSFNHILIQKDQIKVINEIFRVLKNNGICIIDLPNGETKWSKESIKRYGRVFSIEINGIKVTNFLHDKFTLKDIIKKSEFKQGNIKFANIGGRKRIIVELKKIEN